MSDAEKGQVSVRAAEVYEAFFLPALFAQWAGKMAEAAAIGPKDVVLDVACGTGVLARHLAAKVGPEGRVVGLDVNGGMLAVARRQGPEVHWQQGTAEALPFETGVFDAVVCQFGLMFFEDRQRALAEMKRVCRPGGRLAVAVWGALNASPGYTAVHRLLTQTLGQEAAASIEAPFCLGDLGVFSDLLKEAGLGAEILTLMGTAQFDSIRSWLHTEIRGWTLADQIDDSQFENLMTEAEGYLKSFVDPDGKVRFQIAAHIAKDSNN